jgi:SAM-dependent methyltransferase
VECRHCGLIYSNPYFDDGMLQSLYREAAYIDEQQLENMGADYAREFLRAAGSALDRSARVLEIGCANGFFLEKLYGAGYQDLHGVEPGKDAVSKASPAIRERIVNDFFRPTLFEPESFDVVCCFQIFDHLPDPPGFLADVRSLLRPGGLVMTINHNIRALITRVLGERSPMFDIEHIYLFDKSTIRRLFTANGFEVIRVSGLSNSYTLGYAIKMFPLPGGMKRGMLRLLKGPLADVNFRIPAGNMVTVGRKR